MKKTEGIMDIRDMLKPYSPDEKIQKMKKIKNVHQTVENDDQHWINSKRIKGEIKGERFKHDSDAVRANNITNRHLRDLNVWYPNLKEKK